MAGSVHLPQNWRTNPAGGVTRYDNLSASMWRGLKRVREWTIERFEQIPRNQIEVNALHINQEYYEYLIDVAQLEAIVAEIRTRLEQEVPAEQTVSAVMAAYEAGTAAAVVNLAAISDDYTREITQVIQSEPYQRRVALMQSRVFEEMRGFQEDTARDLGRVLSQAVENGESPLETTETIKQRFGVSRSRAERIARTEITGALRRARIDEDRDANQRLGIRTKMLHLSALSPTTRASHAARHGNLYEAQEVAEWYSRDANAINCYLPGTKVRGRFVAGSKAHYTGDAIRIMTASGRDISVTPNHPVMTDRGWVAAAEVTESDNLVAYLPKHEDLGGVANLDGELVGSRVEDVFGSLVDIGHSFSIRVGAVDFHGDGNGMDEYVDVVNVDGVLPRGIDTSGAKLLDDLGLVSSNPVAPSRCTLDKRLGRIRLSASRFMRILSHCRPVLFGGVHMSSDLSFTPSSPGETGILEPPSNGNPGYPGFFAYLKNGFSRHVLGMQSVNVEPALAPANVSPADTNRLEKAANSVLGDAKILGDVLHGFPGLVSLDKVVSVESFEYSGHVYDLEECSGVMIAGGLITSNCKCSQVSVAIGEGGNPLTPGVVEKVRREKRQEENA